MGDIDDDQDAIDKLDAAADMAAASARDVARKAADLLLIRGDLAMLRMRYAEAASHYGLARDLAERHGLPDLAREARDGEAEARERIEHG